VNRAARNIETVCTARELTDSEWSQLSNRWARGIDWCVRRLGTRWTVGDTFAALVDPAARGWPLWNTKVACYDALTALVLAEARRRAAVPS